MTKRPRSTRSPGPYGSPGWARASGFDDRLLAEALGIYEHAGTQRVSLGAGQVDTSDGDFESILVRRAHGMQVAGTLRQALLRVRRWIRITYMVLVIVALIAGGTLAGTMLSGPPGVPVNFYWLLFAAFGVQLAALCLWLILSIIPGLGASSVWLGRAALAVAEWICRRLHIGRATMAAGGAWFAVLRRPANARWSLGIVSHGVWLAANVSFLAMILVLLSARSYTFNWQTTILSDDVFVGLTRAVAWLPEKLAFAAPDHEQIIACGPGATRADLADARTAWAGLLAGCIVVYGIIPRGVLFVVSLLAWRVACSRYRLDLDRFARGYGDLRPTIHPGKRGVATPHDPGLDDDIDALAIDRPQPQVKRRTLGKPTLIGLELPNTLPVDVTLCTDDWMRIIDVDGRKDRDAVLSDLANAPTEPRAVLIAFDLATTPDTGHASFMIEIRSCVIQPVKAILSGGGRMAQDMPSGDDVSAQQQRIDQWRELLTQTGVASQNIVCLDIDHLTRFSCSVLLQHAGATPRSPHLPERFAWWLPACAIINGWAADGAPANGDDFETMEARIDCVFGHDPACQAGPLVQRGSEIIEGASAKVGAARSRLDAVADAARHPLRSAARRAVSRALPRGVTTSANRSRADEHVMQALGECFAHAMHLDLQGRCDQPMITRVIDRVLSQIDPALTSPADVASHWCDAYESLCVSEGIA